MNWKNEFTEALKIDYPIIQAPMLGVTTPAMVAAVANEGGLGALPVGGQSPEKTLELIKQTRALTDKPFSVNLFAHRIPKYDIEKAKRMQDFLVKLCKENGISFEVQPLESFRYHEYLEQIDVLISENIPYVSFTFDVLDDATIKRLKEKNTLLIGSATSVKEAMVLEQKGIKIVVAQGIEAGGHRGSFLKNEPLPLVGLFSLVPQILKHTKLPVIAAGGIGDGHTIKAAFDLGAIAVQVGTAFIASPESLAIPAYKQKLKEALDTDSVLTRAFSGRWAKGIPNKLMRAIEESGLEILPYPIQNSITTALRAAAQKQNNNEFTQQWAGQLAYTAEAIPTAEIFKKLVAQTEALFQ
jgi:nitronate monooxygenase